MTNNKRTYEVFYSNSCDEYGKEFSSSMTVAASNEDEAENQVMNSIDKHYPDGKNTINKIKDISWIP